MEQYYRVNHPKDSCPPDRRDAKTGALPRVIVKYDGREHGEIPEGGSLVLSEVLASHAKTKFPWLELVPTEAMFVEAGSRETQSFPCPQEGCEFSTTDFGAFSAHMKEHIAHGATRASVSDTRSLQEVDRMAEQPRDTRADALKQPPTMTGQRGGGR